MYLDKFIPTNIDRRVVFKAPLRNLINYYLVFFPAQDNCFAIVTPIIVIVRHQIETLNP